MLPPGFRAERSLRIANTFAVAASLAAVTGSFFSLSGDPTRDLHLVAASTLSTFVVGLVWATVLRARRRVTRWRIQLGWMWSVPLAALNAALAAGSLFAGQPDLNTSTARRFVIGAAAGATFGAMIWIPALLLTLLCFGFPIARAQRLAARGLSGEEDGERVVGIVSALLGMGAVVGAVLPRHDLAFRPLPLLVGFGLAAAVTGGLAAIGASARARRRRAFVVDAEAGRVEGYRVHTVPEGKVLVRVETGKEAYRSGERFEAVYELAPDGAATRALTAE